MLNISALLQRAGYYQDEHGLDNWTPFDNGNTVEQASNLTKTKQSVGGERGLFGLHAGSLLS